MPALQSGLLPKKLLSFFNNLTRNSNSSWLLQAKHSKKKKKKKKKNTHRFQKPSVPFLCNSFVDGFQKPPYNNNNNNNNTKHNRASHTILSPMNLYSFFQFYFQNFYIFSHSIVLKIYYPYKLLKNIILLYILLSPHNIVISLCDRSINKL